MKTLQVIKDGEVIYDIHDRVEKVKSILEEEYKNIEKDMPEIEARDNLDSHIFIGWLEALDFALNQIKEQLEYKEESNG